MKIFLTLLVASLIAGCSPSDHTVIFDIEKNGSIKVLSFSDFEGIKTTRLITEEEVNREKSYINLPEIDTDNQTALDKHRQIAIDNNFIIDNNAYNKIIEIPIRSKTNITNLPTDSLDPILFSITRCQELYQPNQSKGTDLSPNLGVVKDDSGFFNYKLYSELNGFASTFLLNDIGDLCISYSYVRGGYEDKYNVQSNEIMIDAQEIKSKLDGLGISHE